MQLNFVTPTPLISTHKSGFQPSRTNNFITTSAVAQQKPPKRPRSQSTSKTRSIHRRNFLKLFIAAPFLPAVTRASGVIDYELDTQTDLSRSSEQDRAAYEELHEEGPFGFGSRDDGRFTAATNNDYYEASRVSSDSLSPRVLLARVGVLGFVAAYTATAMAISEREALRVRLPTVYDPRAIARYFQIRPDKVVLRVALFARETLAVALAWAPHAILSRIDQFAVSRGTKTAEWAAERARVRVENAAAALRDAITRLGPAVIKLGQAAAARSDILGGPVIRELQKLQDDILAFFPTTDAYELIYEELGAWPHSLFNDFSERPIAGASLGMVFKARIDNVPVAVKIQRPEVAENIAMDFYIVRGMANVANFLLRSRTDFKLAVDEYASRLFEELDYTNELRNLNKFRQLYGNLPGIYLPKAFPDYSSRKVLVTEWVDGVKLIDDNAKVRKQDVQLVEIGIQFALDQLLDKGFLHADMHNGNMMRTKSGYLAYIDFGLVAEVPKEVRESLVCALMHLIHGEYTKLAETFVGVALMRSDDIDVDLPILAEALRETLEPRSVDNSEDPNMGIDRFNNFTLIGIVGKLITLGTRFPFVFNDYFLNNLRCLGILEGLALNADPNFNILGVVYPYVVKKMLTDPSPRYKRSLETLLTDSYGRVRWSRLDQLLHEVQAAAAVTALLPLRGGRALGIRTSKLLSTDISHERTRTTLLENGILQPGHNRSRELRSPDLVLQFMMSPSGGFLRQHIIRQYTIRLEEAGRSRVDSMFGLSYMNESENELRGGKKAVEKVAIRDDPDALHRVAMRATTRELTDDQAQTRTGEMLRGTSPLRRLGALFKLIPLIVLPSIQTIIRIVVYFFGVLTKRTIGQQPTAVQQLEVVGITAGSTSTSVQVTPTNAGMASNSKDRTDVDMWSIGDNFRGEQEWRPFDSSFLRRTQKARREQQDNSVVSSVE